MIRVLVVDDHPAIRSGLRGLLRAEPGFDAVAAVSTADEALAEARRWRPDVALTDYELPDKDGLMLARELSELSTPPRVVIYTAFASPRLSLAAALAGAHAVVDKAASVDETLDALREVARGATRFEELTPELLHASAAALDPDDHAIVGLALAGHPPPEIARVLGRRESEVDWRLGLIVDRIRRRGSATGQAS